MCPRYNRVGSGNLGKLLSGISASTNGLQRAQDGAESGKRIEMETFSTIQRKSGLSRQSRRQDAGLIGAAV